MKLRGPSRRGRPLGRWKDRVKEYMCETEGPSRRGRPLERWKDRVKEYMCEIGGSRQSAHHSTDLEKGPILHHRSE